MAGKLSPTAQQRVALLEGFTPLVGRLHALVEQFATARVGHENLNASVKRTASQLKLKLMGVGLDSMSQLCGAIETAASRSGQPAQKARILRENMGSLKFQLELAIRTVIREDDELRAKQKAAKSE
ncbi:MAG TPA: hypothetical protein VFO52_13525 [Longimicrobiales bacterium]|nr:hypothetical protein [Longimicrobiales bacterium]